MSTMEKKIKVGLNFLRRQKWDIYDEVVLLIYSEQKSITNVFSCHGKHPISIGLQGW